MAGTSFAPPHGPVICGSGVRAQLVPRMGYRTTTAAARGPDRRAQPKEIECLLVLASAANSVVKRV